MEITIKINTDSAAFEGYDVRDTEIQRILQAFANKLTVFHLSNLAPCYLYDANGKRCGTVTATEKTD